MATQGIVTVIVGDKVIAKAVAGSDGYNAEFLAAEIKRNHLVNPDEILSAAKRVQFGDKEDLVVQGPDANLFEGDEDLGGLYFDRTKFEDPRFNPRWECGLADHVEIVNFSA